jgi:hypothetical protein
MANYGERVVHHYFARENQPPRVQRVAAWIEHLYESHVPPADIAAAYTASERRRGRMTVAMVLGTRRTPHFATCRDRNILGKPERIGGVFKALRDVVAEFNSRLTGASCSAASTSDLLVLSPGRRGAVRRDCQEPRSPNRQFKWSGLSHSFRTRLSNDSM